jgi:Ca2+-binding EF-hand superfamily protein
LSKAEFLRAFKTDDIVRSFCRERQQLAALLNPKTFKKAFRNMDQDGNSQIDLGEFREAISNLNEELEKELDKARLSVQALNPHAHGAFSQGDLFKIGALDKEVYDVSKYYWESGICQTVARSEFFQNFTLGVIVANALYLGVDTDLNDADKLIDAAPGFIFMEFLFLAYFLFEWVMRFGAFQKKLDGLKDGWFKFDSCLVILMVFETLVMPARDLHSPGDTNAPALGPLRLLRLLRLSRIVRLLRSFPELATMVKAIAAALRAVISSFILVVVLIYVFAIVMKIFLGDDQPTNEYFSTLARCAWTLTIDGIMGDNLGLVLDLMIFRGSFNSTAGVIAFFLFILLAVITIMNMVIGVLCEVVAEVTAAEKEEAEVLFMKKNILVELKKFDDGDGMISEEELNELMTEETSVRVLEALGVDINFLQTLQVMTYEVPEIGVPIPELMEQMLMCRQDTPATMKHLILQQEIGVWMMAHKLMQLENRMYKNLDTRFEILSDSIRAAQNTRMDVDSSEHSCTVSKQLSRDEIAIDESKEAALSKAKAATVVIVREAVL